MSEFSQHTFGYSDHRRRVGGYVRAHPKKLHTPPMELWYPVQTIDDLKAVYGDETTNPFNNPIPYVHHHIATTSSGRVKRYPAMDTLGKAWGDNMLSDGMVMSVRPDDTLTGTKTGSSVFPEQLSGIVWAPYNQKDQLGPGRV